MFENDFVQDIKNGLHIVISGLSKSELEKIIYEFIIRGIKNNQINLLCISKEEEKEWRYALQRNIDLDDMIASQDLIILTHDKIYETVPFGSSFDPLLVHLDNCKKLLKSKEKSGLNIIGTIAGNLLLQQRTNDCINIEKTWHQTIRSSDVPITLLCPYECAIHGAVEARLRKFHDHVFV